MKSAKWENIFKGWDNKESETVHTLKKVPVFKNLSEKDFSELEKMMHQRSYASGDFIFKKKNIVKKLSRTQKSDIYCTGIQILNPKKINDKIKPTDDFNILWKKLIKIRQLYVSDVMPKKWYTVDNVDNLKKLKKIFK